MPEEHPRTVRSDTRASRNARLLAVQLFPTSLAIGVVALALAVSAVAAGERPRQGTSEWWAGPLDSSLDVVASDRGVPSEVELRIHNVWGDAVTVSSLSLRIQWKQEGSYYWDILAEKSLTGLLERSFVLRKGDTHTRRLVLRETELILAESLDVGDAYSVIEGVRNGTLELEVEIQTSSFDPESGPRETIFFAGHRWKPGSTDSEQEQESRPDRPAESEKSSPHAASEPEKGTGG